MMAPEPAPMATPSSVPAWANIGIVVRTNTNIPILSIERMINPLG
jgi:hypothetical protein